MIRIIALAAFNKFYIKGIARRTKLVKNLSPMLKSDLDSHAWLGCLVAAKPSLRKNWLDNFGQGATRVSFGFGFIKLKYYLAFMD